MTKIIAEIGFNYIGDMELCREMVQAAKESGAEYAKFQYFDTKYLKPGPWDTDGRREIYEKAQLTDKLNIVKDICKDVDINFLCTGFSKKHMDILKESDINHDYSNTNSVKIPSMESRNHELLKHSFSLFDTVFMSTGTSEWGEIRENLENTCKDFLTSEDGHKKKLVLMHCVSSYPCLPKHANLPKIRSLKALCKIIPGLDNFQVGFSDHCEGIEVAKMSLEYGVDWIEKHFTIDRNLPGRDNKFSILPDEMYNLKRYIEEREEATEYLGCNFQDIEKETREKYTGRWSGNE